MIKKTYFRVIIMFFNDHSVFILAVPPGVFIIE